MEKLEILKLTDSQRICKIRLKAKQQNLTATKSRRDGLWYFANLNNVLVSYANGLNDVEAVEFLK